MQDRLTEPEICLTEEEAVGLLELVMTCPNELSSDQRAAMLKLSEFCRQFLREPVDAAPSLRLAGISVLSGPYAA